MPESLILFVSFLLVALASREIGHLFGKYHLPYITGYLFAGVLVGPFILNLIPKGSSEQLIIIDHLSLAIIAFIAGSELFIEELRSRVRSIMMNTIGVVIAGIIINSFVFFLLMEFMPFASGMPFTSRIAVAILGSTILLALSPPSTIAIIQEVRAYGPFSKTILSMTVVMDVIVIVLFAIFTAVLVSFLEVNEPLDLTFVVQIIIGLFIAVGSGVAVGYAISRLLGTNLHKWLKVAVISILGISVFIGATEVTEFTRAFGFEMRIEALLICMIAGFYVANFSDYRYQFEHLLHDISPVIYIAFFTLIGIGLKLDILFSTIGLAIILFGIRIFSIMIGSFVGGNLAREDKLIKRYAWMGLITQAGIALGLAREVATEFPALGNSFATVVVSVVLLNEIFGPLFLKHVLHRVGESHVPTKRDAIRNVIIFGVDQQSILIAKQLVHSGWQVKLGNDNVDQANDNQDEAIECFHFDVNNHQSLKQFMNTQNAIVAMLDDDDLNFTVCQIAYEEYGIRRIIVRLNETNNAPRFEPFNPVMIDTASALANQISHSLRSPRQSK